MLVLLTPDIIIIESGRPKQKFSEFDYIKILFCFKSL